MATRTPRFTPGLTTIDGAVIAVVAAAAVTAGGLWLAGQAASALTGRGWASGSPVAGVEALAHSADPATAWNSPMPPPAAYWSITVGTVAALVVTILAIAGFTRGKTRTRRKVCTSCPPGTGWRNLAISLAPSGETLC